MGSAFIGLIVVLAVFGMIGTVVWYVFLFIVARKAFSAVMRNLDRTIPEVERNIRQYAALSPDQKQLQHPQVLAMIMRAQNEIRQLDNLHRQQYDARMGQMVNMAADAGISWTPPAY